MSRARSINQIEFHRRALLSLITDLFTPIARAHDTQIAVPRQVLGFYYGWYRSPDVSGRYSHWFNSADNAVSSETKFTPLMGRYDSHDTSIISRQISEAKAAGLTGFIASWWGPNSYTDQGMDLLLASATHQDFSITAYYEGPQPSSNRPPTRELHDQSDRIAGIVEDLEHVLSRYGNAKSWLKVGTRPVVFLYSRAVYQIPADAWKQVRRDLASKDLNPVLVGDALLNTDMPRAERERSAFHGLHAYGVVAPFADRRAIEIFPVLRRLFEKWVHDAPTKIVCATVMPGYDDTARADRKPPRPILHREDGVLYELMWKAALEANPDWVLVSTWNEWTEGSQIEPSVELGAKDLEITSRHSIQFRSQSGRYLTLEN